MKNVFILLVIVLVAGAAIFILKSRAPEKSTSDLGISEVSDKKGTQTSSLKFSTPKKSAHFETNTPAHGAILAGVPVNVVVDFNFDLARPSEIKVMRDGKDYGAGETTIDSNKLSMRRDVDANSPDGLYIVSYNACWPDGSCHDGHFQFAIERSRVKEFDDQTGKGTVTIKMSQIKFVPQNVKITKGTKVTWINDDTVEHYVNTDSHPAHTYYTAQNSKAIKAGGSYSLTFDEAGIYPYHCSAHAATMAGALLVE